MTVRIRTCSSLPLLCIPIFIQECLHGLSMLPILCLIGLTHTVSILYCSASSLGLQVWQSCRLPKLRCPLKVGRYRISSSAGKKAQDFSNSNIQPVQFAGLSLLALKTLRLVTMLIGTVLFMPFLEILFVAVSCFGENSTLIEYPDVQCFNGPYSAQTVIAIIMLLIFVPYNVIMASIYMETSPHRSSRMARVPIGRFDTICK